jgi:hypothetical protein
MDANLILNLALVLAGFFALISCAVLLLILAPITAYYLARVLLKMIGLFSVSPARFRKDLIATAISGTLASMTSGCFFILAVIGYLTCLAD